MERPLETLSGWNAASARRVFVRGLEIAASIGVHPHEHQAAQPVLIGIELLVDSGAHARTIVYAPPLREGDPAARDVVCYESLSNMVRDLVAHGHIDYVETLAERIAENCLRDDRVVEAIIRVEKPKAIAGAASAGVEIVRRR